MGSEWKRKVAQRFGARAEGYDAHSEVQQRTALSLAAFLPELGEAPKIFEIGCGTGGFTRHILETYGAQANLLATDISPAMVEQAQAAIKDARVRWAVMDGERPKSEERYDLIVSHMSVQWFTDLRGALVRLRKMLAPGGQVLYSMPGPGTFAEWREVLAEMGLESGVLDFRARPEIFAREEFIAQHESAFDFLRSVKSIGAHTPRAGHKPLDAGAMRKACARFDALHEGRVRWEILFGRIYAAS